LSAESITAVPWVRLSSEDPRRMIPIQEVADLLDVDPQLLKRQHQADPDNYPAERIGTLWRIPRWWVERKILPPEATP
jgi:hypothetical protein